MMPGPKTKPDVYIIESLDFNDEERRCEGEIISRSLRLAGKDPIYRYVRTRKEFEHFVSDFATAGYRYLHVSCHGSKGGIHTTFDEIEDDAFAGMVGGALEGSRLFLSTCLATTEELAAGVFANGGCLSVAGPRGEIAFDDSVILWTAFYHLMFKKNAQSMKRANIELNLSKAGLILDEKIRLSTPGPDGKPVLKILPPNPSGL